MKEKTSKLPFGRLDGLEFRLDPEQTKRFLEWRDSRNPNKNAGAIGGTYTFSFTPTSLGVIAKAKDKMGPKEGNEIDLTRYLDW